MQPREGDRVKVRESVFRRATREPSQVTVNGEPFYNFQLSDTGIVVGVRTVTGIGIVIDVKHDVCKDEFHQKEGVTWMPNELRRILI